MAGFVEMREPPRYVDTSTSPTTETQITCNYCALELTRSTLKEHLVASHVESLFHCDDCDTYVDKKDFITHMSQHALQYSDVINEPKNIKKTNNGNETDKAIDISIRQIEESKDDDDSGNKTNEFSDHSDTEDGFGPLPESVFEAIEDSQDSQPDGDETLSITANTESFPTPPGSENSNPIPTLDKIKSHKKTRTCPVCSKVYTASSSFFYHMKHHHRNSKDHECDVCGKKFGTKANLVAHSYIHTGECQFECKTCGKRFKSKASLYIHEQIHNGVKRHACAQCHRAFRWKNHLVRHMKRHSSDKPHACAVCGRGFNIRGDLLRHTRTHTAGNFACSKCGLKFAQLRYLNVHMHKKHSAVVS